MTFWTRSSQGKRAVAAVKIVERGPVDFGTKGVDEAYRELIGNLVHDITGDFRTRYR